MEKATLFKEESLPLITFNNETQKFEVNHELKPLLEALRGPVGVIAVAGQYRTGKSYLLNRMLLNRQKGFGVGPSINPCTKGLWIWGTPIQGQTKDGKPINILVVDSEGIGGLDEDNNHDMRIFSLAMLLSSYFLYNSVGSIDENALANLSLVTNLTKHIQFRSSISSSNEEDDLDSLIDYMPSFMWVVRDFALQLCDEDGNDINSQEYLERALMEKGSDQKNEIRRHLKMFFKDRQCCTMIRPLTNEDELQNLEQMELIELRAEFVEQIMILRRKVLGNMKPKAINSQPLDAVSWFQMVEQYVQAINEGCVPNIQSSWTYICRQNAAKALEEAQTQFDKDVQEQIQLPLSQDDLAQTLKIATKDALQILIKALKCEPEISKEFIEELERYTDMKSTQLLRQNTQECRQYAQALLSQLFSEFDQQIKSQKQPFDVQQVELTLRQLAQVYGQNAFDFDEKGLLLAEAKAQFLQDALFLITKRLEADLDLSRQLESQAKERLESQLREAKEEQRQERQRVEDKLREVTLEKTELEAQVSVLREQYEILRESKDQEERDLKEQLALLRESKNAEMEALRSSKEEFEERLQEVQRHLIQAESEFDKERALFAQKVEFLEQSLEEKQAKERDFMAERQSQKQGVHSELRNMQLKYESDIKLLQTSLDEEREKLLELESQLKDQQLQFEEKSEIWSQQEVQYKSMINQAQDQARQMELTVAALRKENESKLNLHAREKDGRFEQVSSQVTELEQQLRETYEQLKQREHDFKKERAIKDQKLEFLEMQLQDCKQQLEESYKQHEQMVRAMRHDDDLQKPNNLSPGKFDSLQQEYAQKQEELMGEIQDLRAQLDQSLERLTEAELQAKLAQTDFERDISDLRMQLQESEASRQQLLERAKSLELQKAKLVEEGERAHKEAVVRFEEEMEANAQQQAQELKDMQEKSEEALAQLRSFFETEKEKSEQRISEEREKGGKRLQMMQEELELRFRDELQEKEDEIECLQNELRESEQRHQGYVTQMEHELSLKHHLLENLERQVRDQKDRIELLEHGKYSAFERQIEHFEQQRQEYNQKIEKLQIENLEKDRLVAQTQHRLERLQEDLDRKRLEHETTQASLDREKKQLSDKLEGNKRKLTEAMDEAMRHKLESGREQALAKQQFKAEIQEEAQSQIDRVTSEKEFWENKYEQKRKALKELELALARGQAEQEKKAVGLQQLVDRLEEEKRQMEEQFHEEVQALNQQLQALDSSAGAAYYYGSAHAEDVLRYKAQVQDLERELSDLQSTYDRDKALWEGKCQFLETQKETYKRDLLESQKKFEITLEQLQKRGSMDKDKFENSQNSLMKVMEARYKSQIKELMETHQCLQSEGQQKVKRLEQELKLRNEQLQLEARSKQGEYGSLEKRAQDLAESERRLQQELEEAKKERDRRVGDLQRQMDKDKEQYKAKLGEYEQKAKDAESRRSALMFEFEKERAKWQLEKDNLNNIRAELTDQVEKLQLRKDQLLRENEKLRTENKGSRKYLFGNASNTTPNSGVTSLGQTQHHAGSSATRYMVGKSMTGAVGSSLGQAIAKMKENQATGVVGQSAKAGQMGSYQGSATSSVNEDFGSQQMPMTYGPIATSQQKETTPKRYNRYGN